MSEGEGGRENKNPMRMDSFRFIGISVIVLFRMWRSNVRHFVWLSWSSINHVIKHGDESWKLDLKLNKVGCCSATLDWRDDKRSKRINRIVNTKCNEN